MQALLITGNSGEHVEVTAQQIANIAKGMEIHDLRTIGDMRQYFLRTPIEGGYRTALFSVGVGSYEESVIRLLPTEV